MNIKICENLKELRRQKGNTQEELAEHLNISMQAVSKWERNESYPDITLVPALALYYNVTSDQLLGIDDMSVNAKIQEYKARSLEIQNQSKDEIAAGNYDDNQIKQIALWREAVKEFPNNHTVLFHLLQHLVFAIWNVNKYFDEIVQIGERLLAESTDNDIRFYTIKFLCNTYAEQKDFENAKKYANMAPSYYSSKEILYGRCLTGEEKIKYRQQNIRDFINTIHGNFIQDMSICGQSVDELIKMFEFSYKLFHLLYNDEKDHVCVGYLHGVCNNLIHLHSSHGNIDGALYYLNEYAELSVKTNQYLNSQEEFKYTSSMLNRLNFPENKYSKDIAKIQAEIIIKEIEEDKNYDCVRNDERYTAAMEKLKALLE